MRRNKTRVDSSLIDPGVLDQLEGVVYEDQPPALVGREGVRIPLPPAIFHVLVETIRAMKQGRTIVLLPEDETCTSQAAADFLGMSRQFLVNLLDKGEIPHHRVGAHRRVYFKDLRDYQKTRDTKRRKTLSTMFADLDAAGVSDVDLSHENPA